MQLQPTTPQERSAWVLPRGPEAVSGWAWGGMGGTAWMSAAWRCKMLRKLTQRPSLLALVCLAITPQYTLILHIWIQFEVDWSRKGKGGPCGLACHTGAGQDLGASGHTDLSSRPLLGKL